MVHFCFRDTYADVRTIIHREFFLVIIEEDESLITEILRVSVGFASWLYPTNKLILPGQDNPNEFPFEETEYDNYIILQKLNHPLNPKFDSKFFSLSIEVHFDKLIGRRDLPVGQLIKIQEIFSKINEDRIKEINQEEEEGSLSDPRSQLTY